jgi:hypothetical protein
MSDNKEFNKIFIKEYISLINEVSLKQTRNFFFCTLSSKNRFMPFFYYLESKFKNPTTKYLKPQIQYLKNIELCMKTTIITVLTIFLGRKNLKNFKNLKNQIIFKTFIYESNINKEIFIDPFWSDLSNNGAIVYDPLVTFSSLRKFIKMHENHLPIFSFITLLDIVKCWFIYLRPFIFRKKLHFTKLDANTEINLELNYEFKNHTTFHNLLFYFAFKNIAQTLKVKKIFITYENNCWERAAILAFRKYSTKTEIIGYQHAAINEASINYYLTEYEVNHLLPNKILTSGPKMTEFLIQSGHPKDKVLTFGALRYSYLKNIKLKTTPLSKTLLVSLEGVIQAISMIHYLEKYEQTLRDNHIQVTIRFHPIYPFERMRSLISPTIFSNGFFKVSTAATIAEDFTNHDFIMYQGSTVALEALKFGLRPIHYHDAPVLLRDPLFLVPQTRLLLIPEGNIVDLINRETKIDLDRLNEIRHLNSKEVDLYLKPIPDEEKSKLFSLFI